mgnify:CR=1 FL=1
MGHDMGEINIFTEGWVHHKNGEGMTLMNCEQLQFHMTFNPNINYDWILNLSEIKDYPNCSNLIFGPQIMFPNIDTNQIPTNKNYICNVLSPWVVSLCEDINPEINFQSLPFAVNVNKFNLNLILN